MYGHAQGELLAQSRPGVTIAFPAFIATLRTEITLIRAVVDPDSGPATLDIVIYHDDDGGSTYDMTTVIYAGTRTRDTQDATVFQAQHPGSGIHMKPGAQLAIKTSDANDVNFSIYGITENIAPDLEA